MYKKITTFANIKYFAGNSLKYLKNKGWLSAALRYNQ